MCPGSTGQAVLEPKAESENRAIEGMALDAVEAGYETCASTPGITAASRQRSMQLPVPSDRLFLLPAQKTCGGIARCGRGRATSSHSPEK